MHYSWPPRPDVDVPAEMELELGKSEHVGVDAAKAAAAKSLVVREGQGYGAGAESVIKLADEEFGALLAKFTSLEELHWHNVNVTESLVRAVLAAAPHLRRNLTALHFPLANLDPEALALLAGCEAVQTLDFLDAFSTENYDFDGGYGSDRDEGKPLPSWDKPLMACVRDMPNLKQI